jgi:hypothetical protein
MTTNRRDKTRESLAGRTADAGTISAKLDAAQAANVRFYGLFISHPVARREPPLLQIEPHSR